MICELALVDVRGADKLDTAHYHQLPPAVLSPPAIVYIIEICHPRRVMDSPQSRREPIPPFFLLRIALIDGSTSVPRPSKREESQPPPPRPPTFYGACLMNTFDRAPR